MHDTVVLRHPLADHAVTSPPALVCSWTDGGPEAAWVHVAGELDLATVPQLERTLRLPQLQAQLVVLDLRELALIDSFGVEVIVNESNRARRTGRQLILLRGAPSIDRMFTLTGSADNVEIGDLDPFEQPVQPRFVEPPVRTRAGLELAS